MARHFVFSIIKKFASRSMSKYVLNGNCKVKLIKITLLWRFEKCQCAKIIESLELYYSIWNDATNVSVIIPKSSTIFLSRFLIHVNGPFPQWKYKTY